MQNLHHVAIIRLEVFFVCEKLGETRSEIKFRHLLPITIKFYPINSIKKNLNLSILFIYSFFFPFFKEVFIFLNNIHLFSYYYILYLLIYFLNHLTFSIS